MPVVPLGRNRRFFLRRKPTTGPHGQTSWFFLQVAVQTLPSGVRGIVATANLPEGHVIVDLPASCTAFSAEVRPTASRHDPGAPPPGPPRRGGPDRAAAARFAQAARFADSELGVGAAIAKHEGALLLLSTALRRRLLSWPVSLKHPLQLPRRAASSSQKLSDEAVLALYLAASAQGGASDLGAPLPSSWLGCSGLGLRSCCAQRERAARPPALRAPPQARTRGPSHRTSQTPPRAGTR